MRSDIEKLEDYLNNNINETNQLRVLEAGCGSSSKFNLKQKKYLIGLDISQKQLDRNSELNEKILGDLQSFEFSPSYFDIIACWDVLEHLNKPELALINFKKWIKPGGLIILKLPNVLSIKGLLTKFTPYRFHIFVHKYIYKYRHEDGTEDLGPFKTYLRFSISSFALKSFAKINSLKVDFFHPWDIAETLRTKNLLVFYAYSLCKTLIKVLTFGKISDSEFIMVLKK